MKLLTQSDDYGFTRGVTCGILDAIENGVVRNTGLFVNMPESEHAASFIQDYPQVCFGIDFNIVSGDPVSPGPGGSGRTFYPFHRQNGRSALW